MPSPSPTNEAEALDADRFLRYDEPLDGPAPALGFSRHAVLEASAGTGKTYAVERLAARLVAEGYVRPDPDGLTEAERGLFDRDRRPARLLAITFTDKAAADMAARIRATLEDEARKLSSPPSPAADTADRGPGPARRDIIARRLRLAARHFPETVEVATLHGFCQRALVRHAPETGAAFDAPVVDADSPRREALHAVLTGPELAADYGDWLGVLLEAAGWPALASSKDDDDGDSGPKPGWLNVAARLADGDELLRADLMGGPAGVTAYSSGPAAADGAGGPPRAALDRDGEIARGVVAALNEWRDGWGGEAWYDRVKERCAELKLSVNAGKALLNILLRPWFDAVAYWPNPLCAARQWLGDLINTLAGDETKNKAPLRDLLDRRLAGWTGWEDQFTKGRKADSVDAIDELTGLFAPLADLRDPVRDFMNDVAGRVARRTDELVRRRGLLTFDRMITQLSDALKPAAPAAGRLAAALRRRHRFVIVDEFQDTDRRQWDILRAAFLADDAPETGLVVVGDPKQSIYGFRDADLRVYNEAVGVLRGRRDAKNWRLADNHRSVHPLVDALNGLFGAVPDNGSSWFDGADGVRFPPAGKGGATKGKKLENDPLAENGRRGALTFIEIPGDITKTENVRRTAVEFAAREIKRLLAAGVRRSDDDGDGARKLSADDCCVLVRGGGEFDLVDRVFKAHGLPIAYYKRPRLPESDAAAALSAVLAALADPRDAGLCTAAWLTPYFDLTPMAAAALARDPFGAGQAGRAARETVERWELWCGWAAKGHWPRLFNALKAALAERDGEKADDAFIDQTGALLEDLAGFAARRRPSAAALRDRLRRFIDGGGGQDDDKESFLRRDTDRPRVSVMSMHVAKGLEFPVVFVLGGMGGQPPGRDKNPVAGHFDPSPARRCFAFAPLLPPVRDARDREEDAENRRLFYVALTRAQYRLYLPLVSEAFAQKSGSVAAKLIRPAALKLLAENKNNRSPAPAPTLDIAVAVDDAVDGAEAKAAAPVAVTDDTAPPPDYPDWDAAFKQRPPLRTSYSSLTNRVGPGAGADALETVAVRRPPDYADDDADDVDDADIAAVADDGRAIPGNDEMADGDDGGDGADATDVVDAAGIPYWERWRGGRSLGLALHAVLEKADFAEWAARLDAVADPADPEAWTRFWLDDLTGGRLVATLDAALTAQDCIAPATAADDPRRLGYRALLARMIRYALNVPLPLQDDGTDGDAERERGRKWNPFRLRSLSRGEYRSEIPFVLPATPTMRWPPATEEKAAGSTPGASSPPPFATTESGWIVGNIDLLFRAGGRYWVLDWKSDKLRSRPADTGGGEGGGGDGGRDGKGVVDPYGPEGVGRQFREHYTLQAVIYSLAARRWLQAHDPSADGGAFGGVVYLFARAFDSRGGGVYVARADDSARLEAEVAAALRRAYGESRERDD